MSHPMLTWGEFYPTYLDRFSVSRHRKSTTTLHAFCCKRLAERFGDTPLSRIDDLAVDEFVSWRRKSVKPRTVNIEIAVLHRALKIAVRWGHLKSVPFKFEKLDEGPLRTPTLDLRKRKRLLEAAGVHRDVILFFLTTGLRRGELRDLKWDDVEADGIRVRDSKTKTSRWIPLTPLASGVLQGKRRLRDLSGTVFLNPKTGAPYRDLSHIVKRILRRAGLPDFSLHSLRHCFATSLHEAGAGLADLMEILGHKSPEMSRRYIHPSPSRLTEVMRAIDKNFEAWEQTDFEYRKKTC